MNLLNIGYIIAAGLFWIVISTWIDVKLYKNEKTRHLVEDNKEIKNEHDLIMEFGKINASEVFIFLLGFFVAYLLIVMGWV